MEPLHLLLHRFGAGSTTNAVIAASVSLTTAVEAKTDPWGILGYMTALGMVVRSLDDLLLINIVADEEELSAHQVAEGVAVTVASEGDWLLFRP